MILYPRIPSQQRWFIRFRFLGVLSQIKYFWKDYIIKRPYKVIRFSGEFQQELLHVIPHAYWHKKNGTLLKTISSSYTKCLYFFSDNHVEDSDIIRDHVGNYDLDIPNAPHDTKLLKIKWHGVPFKEQFENQKYLFSKETIVIANRYNTEWNGDPVSWFSLADLESLIGSLKADYQVVYNRPTADKISNDNSIVLELGDELWLKENHPEVIFLPDLLDSTIESYNELQMKVYANCSKFISIHGGTSTLASMFGGVNFILSKKGHEHPLKEFENVFPQLSGCEIRVHKESSDLVQDVIFWLNEVKRK